jgi:hypothetical protein
MFSWAAMLVISSCVVSVSVAVRVRSNVAKVVAGRGECVELCHTVAERANMESIGACAAIAGLRMASGCIRAFRFCVVLQSRQPLVGEVVLLARTVFAFSICMRRGRGLRLCCNPCGSLLCSG